MIKKRIQILEENVSNCKRMCAPKTGLTFFMQNTISFRVCLWESPIKDCKRKAHLRRKLLKGKNNR